MGYMILGVFSLSKFSQYYGNWRNFYNHLYYCSLFHVGEKNIKISQMASGILLDNVVIINEELVSTREVMGVTREYSAHIMGELVGELIVL